MCMQHSINGRGSALITRAISFYRNVTGQQRLCLDSFNASG